MRPKSVHNYYYYYYYVIMIWLIFTEAFGQLSVKITLKPGAACISPENDPSIEPEFMLTADAQYNVGWALTTAFGQVLVILLFFIMRCNHIFAIFVMYSVLIYI